MYAKLRSFTGSRAVRAIVQILLIVILMSSLTACAALQMGAPAISGSASSLGASAFAPITIADGQILATSSGTTLWGVANAISQAPGTTVMLDAKSESVLFAWPVPNVGTAWVIMKNTAEGFNEFIDNCGGKGNIANYQTWSQFKAFMTDKQGWSMAKASAASAGLITRLILTAGATLAKTASSSVIDILVIPATTLDQMENMLHGSETLS